MADWTVFQADALSKYKPVINSTSLISDLEGMEATISKALEYFGNTRHIIVYYEDLINNRTVRLNRFGLFIAWC